MGSVGAGLTKPIADFIGDQVGKTYEKIGGNWAGKTAIDLMWSMGRSFKGHPTGEALTELVAKGVKARNDSLDETIGPITNYQKAVHDDPKLAQHFDYKTTNLKSIHGTLSAANHPAAATLDPLMADANNHSLTLHELKGKGIARSNMIGRETAFGPKDINLAATLYPMLKSANPVERTKATAWQGILAQVFKDTESMPNVGERSGIKVNVAGYYNKMQKAYGGEPGSFDVRAEFKGQVPWEEKAQKYAMRYLAPFIALAHVSDFAKLGLAPQRELFSSFAKLNDKDLQDMKTASGIFAHTYHSIWQADFDGRTGKIAQKLGSPDAGALIHKAFNNPGFNQLRMLQLSIMGGAGHDSALMWAKQAALRGDPRAIAELKEMHLDVPSIIKRGGELTDDELQTAIFHYANNRLFIDNPIERARFAQKSPFTRVASMFHGYITKNGYYLTRELGKLAKANDYKGIAQFAAAVGVVFPAAAPLLYSAETYVRTLSVEKAKQSLEDDYGGLAGKRGVKGFASTYIKLLAHFGSAGAFMQYVHAAANHRLASAMLGAVPGVLTGTGDDLVTGLKGQFSGKHSGESLGEDWERYYRPLTRDILRYATIPIIGGWTAEHMIPKGRVSSGRPRKPSRKIK